VQKIVQSVSDCKQCPNRVYGSGGVYECLRADRAPLLKTEAIPEWCPLANDAAPVAARARKALQDARDVLDIAMTEAGNPDTSPARLRELIKIAQEQTRRTC
jgi:hypothetical protein